MIADTPLSAYDAGRELHIVRCRGCRRRLALSSTPRTPTFCNELCAYDYPAAENEDRNALIWALSKYDGVRQTRLAVDFGVARQWVNKVVVEWSRP